MKNQHLFRMGLICGVGIAISAISAQAGTQATFYVSPSGNDANPGTSELTAFGSLARARDAVRAINNTMTGDIVVEIAKGDYPVTDTIAFTTEDSGTNGFNVIYKNQDGIGTARFMGGVKVTDWEPYKDQINQVDVGAGLEFTTLYENGIRADLARWPKRTSPFATSRGGYMIFTDKKGENIYYQDNALSPEGTPFDPAGKDFSNAWVYAWNGGDGHRWSSVTTGVTSVGGGTIGIKGCGLGWPPDSFLIEGSLGLLTRPGEFYYDKNAGILYYYSRFSGPLEKQEILVPKVVRLIEVSGASDPVHNIQFSGLAFTGTDRIAQSGADDWSDHQQCSWDAAIFVKNARDIVVQKCKVSDAGINGIDLDDNTQSCTIEDCLVEHVGYGGVDIKGAGNTVRNCLIRFCGELRGHGRGVNVLGDGNTLTNLDIYCIPRAGVGIGSKNNTVSYVKVRECNQDSGDQGGFYLVDPAADNSFNQCTSFHHYTDLSNMDRPPTAVYNDRDAINTVWANIDAGDSQMFTFRHDPQRTGTLTFNNVSWDPKCNPRANEAAGPVNPDFDKSAMEYDKIGISSDFPSEYNALSAAPAAPLNFWAQPGDGQVTLNWTEADRAERYNIKRATISGGPYTTAGVNAVPATGWDMGTTFTDTGVTNGATYYYVVTSSNKAGESVPSPELKVTPDPAGSNKLTGTVIGAGGNPEAAFDGDPKTCFESQNGWAGLDLGEARIITEVRYTPRSDNTDTTARMCGGRFQGADDADFTNPVTLFTVIGTKGGAGTPVLIPQAIYNKTPFRYVRFVGPNGKTTVAEIEFYGYSPR